MQRRLRAILTGVLGPFVFTTAALLLVKGLSYLGSSSLVGVLAPFLVVLSTAAGLKLLTPALSRFRIFLSVAYFLLMLGLQFWYGFLLVGHLFGDWL